MEYFIMSQDRRIQNVFVMKEFRGRGSLDYDTSYADKLKDHTSLFTIESDGSSYPDMLEAPLVMVSKKVHDVLELYDETAVYKKVSMINRPKNTRKEYYVMLLDRIDCLHEDATFYPDRSIKQLVLDKEKIGERQIFKIQGIGPAHVIVSLDIAESLLRRSCYGIQFTKVKCR